ncbi:unnamed protein product [Medioppia subpectinata]|uniref:F-box domain-containing protein n=1 Tax=Medioppia subpectinata TaxID=1979941 RepID=A0A7R9KAR2_9ACAR|nr:unnamed protein product [Medioppia subpectinata]CAG2099959.1 unnamed protein product [Medioppia subpectinata]
MDVFILMQRVVNLDELKCFLGGNCEITVDNRKHCKRCRLNKCLAAGMKTRLIYSRKLKWDINYLNDNQVVEDSSNSGEDLLSSDFSDNQCIDESVGNVCDDNISTNISEQQLVSINRPLTDYSTVFNELEANRFTELLNGIKKLQSIVKIRDQTIVDEMSDGFRVMNIKHENGIKDIVQMSKLLSGFSDLCAEDQLVLIKYSSIEINLLRMVSLFNFQECYWDIGDSSYLVRLDLFKHHKLIGEMQTTYDCHTEFLQSIGHDWESDPLIIDFLTAILLFNANRPHLSDRTLINGALERPSLATQQNTSLCRALIEEMSSRRRHVMNDDILLDLFKYLDIKDLFSLQRVSQQFSRCSQQVLQKKREVSVGFNDLKRDSRIRCFKPNFEVKDWNRLDITPAISFIGINLVLNHNRNQNMESIVRQFRDVKKLYLSTTVISFKTLELIVNQWSHLEEIYINGIDIYDSSDKTITEWTQLLSKVKHITIGSIDRKYVSLLTDIIKYLPSLQSVNVWRLMDNQSITLSVLTDCLSANIQFLTIGVNPADSQALEVITTKCQQIKKLCIYECYRPVNVTDFDLWNQWFAMVCHRLKALKYLKFVLFDISAKELAKNIAKLNELQTLDITFRMFSHIEDFPRMCFDTQEMAKYMQPMVSLKTLSLREMKCSPNRWSNFSQIFPNVRKLTFGYMYYRSECKHGDDCIECFYRCMDSVSKLPKLKHIFIGYAPNGCHITRHILELFANVDQLSIEYCNEDIIDELIHFIVFTLDNRRRVFRLNMWSNDKRRLIERMATIDIPMNGCVIFGHLFYNQRIEEMSSRRRHVMNDDILLDIFKRLDLKDLFGWQRVSQQFSRCSQQVLKCKREVSVGFNDFKTNSKIRWFKQNFEVNDWNLIDITPAISLIGINLVLNHNRNQNMESIVRQFRDVKKLYLSTTVISFKTLELIVNQWPHLEELLVYDIDIYDSSDKTITEWTQLLFKVKHITIGSIDRKYVSLLTDIIANLPSFQSVNVWRISGNQTITLSVLTDCLSANIQSLKIGVNPADSQAIDVITTKCQQIKKLSIYESYRPVNVTDFDFWNQWFAMVCDRLKALKYLKFIFFDISAKELAKNMAKLNELQTLIINCLAFIHTEDFTRMCFDTQEMARYMRPMVSLKTLSLRGMNCSPNRWSNFSQIFPNVRQLTVDYMYYRSDCKHGDDCNECFYRCMDCVSKLPKLKHIFIGYAPNGCHITQHILELFASVDQLSIDYCNEDMIDELIHFIVFTLDNRRREFRLNMWSNDKRLLIQRMATIDIPMNVIRGLRQRDKEMSSRRRHVMNDDIMLDIFKRLDIKDLFSLQRVSQQFSRCSQGVIRTKKIVSIGFNDLETTSGLRRFNRSFEAKDWNRIDITPAITISMIGIDLAFGYRLESIVRQFRGVKYLYLSSTVITFKILEFFINQWPRLESLHINRIDLVATSETVSEWAQLLSTIKYINIRYIDGKYVSFLINIMQRMSSLQALKIWCFWSNIWNQTTTVSLLTDCLSVNIKSLDIGVTPAYSQAIDVITSKCPQITRLHIYESWEETNSVEFDLWNQWFVMICDRLKCLQHLNTRLGDISAKVFAQSLAKLENLKALQIIETSNDWIQSMCFDTQGLAKYVRPMVSMRSLSLNGLKCSPNRWSNLAQIFPNVRKMSVDYMYCRTDCKDGNDCNLCFYRCMKRVSKLPELKHIIIGNVSDGRITRHIVELFAGVNRLSINGRPEEDLIEVLIHFLTETLANRRRVFCLDLLPIVKKKLIQKMEEMDVSMPESVIVGHVFSTQYAHQ